MTDEDRLVADRYRLGAVIGSGATGVVWRAVDERLRRAVALKRLAAAAGRTREHAFREARVTARLHHPNVVLVFDVVDDGDGPWLVLEYVPSHTLATALRTGPLEPDQVVRIGAQAAAGLAAAHAIGVLHRDVRPGNVLLGEDGIVKVADFGLSPAGTGAPGYLAPELVTGGQPAPAADVFGLGATLSAAVAGALPTAGGRVRSPRPLAGLLTELLRADPADRPTMRQAHAELARMASASGPLMIDPMRAWTTPVDGGGPPEDPGPPTVGVRLPTVRWRLLRLTVAVSGYRAWPLVRSALPIRCR